MTFEELMKLKVGDRIIAKGKTLFDTKAGNKGGEAAIGAIEMANLNKMVESI